MLSIEQALEKIESLSSQYTIKTSETIPLRNALHRVLAQAIASQINVPPYANSAMDGFAINCENSDATPFTLALSQRIPAGSNPATLEPNTAAQIFTGAIIPDGANAVVMQENCSEDQANNTVTILQQAKTGENIRNAGEDIQKDSLVLDTHARLSPAHLALLASTGCSELEVFRKLRVGILSTGDELVPTGTPLKRGEIYDSNRIMLEAFCSVNHCEISASIHVRDSHDETVLALKSLAEQSDLVVSCGGVSVGEEDHVKAAIESLGEIDFWKIFMKPGKPLSVGLIQNTPFLALPGNPVSAFVTMQMFGVSMLRIMSGETQFKQKPIKLAANFNIERPRQRPEFARVKITDAGLELFPHQGSGVLSSVCWADALALIPNDKIVSKGDMLTVFPLN